MVHRAGIKHSGTGSLFRLETTGADDRSLDDDLPVLILRASPYSESEDVVLSTIQALGHSSTHCTGPTWRTNYTTLFVIVARLYATAPHSTSTKSTYGSSQRAVLWNLWQCTYFKYFHCQKFWRTTLREEPYSSSSWVVGKDGPLPKTKKGNEYVVLVTDGFSNLTRAVPVTKTTALYMSIV